MTPSRAHPIEGLHSFWDFGGYDTVDGLKIARGTLFRASNLGAATAKGKKDLDKLGIKLVCDLRSVKERRDAPLDLGAVHVLSSDLNRGTEKAINAYWKDGDLSVEGAKAFMLNLYRAMPFELAHMELAARLFKALAVGDAPAVIMSSAGRHRSGFLCALTLVAAGVSRDIAMSDYLLTNTMISDKPEDKKEEQARASKRAGRTVGEEVLNVLTHVDRVYLDAALDAVKAQYGTVYGYLRDGLKIGAHETEALRATILE